MAKATKNGNSGSPYGGRELVYVPLEEVTGDEANPKAHDVDLIGDSVGRFGYVEPIVEDGRTGKLISGHGRTAALRAMLEQGQEAPDGVQVDDEGRWLVPVSRGWSSRSDQEARAALIALNRTGEVGGWVDASLIDLLDELAHSDAGLEGVGYVEDDLEQLRSYVDAIELTTNWSPEDDELAPHLDGRDDSFDTKDGDGDDDAVGAVDLPYDQRAVTVVYEKDSRQDLYSLLSDIPYVINVRDKIGN